MLVTRSDQAKRALVDLLQAQTASLVGVQTDYSDQGQETWRESIYLGAVQSGIDGEDELKLETATIPLFIRVVDPAKTPEEADQRAVAIGQVVQDVLDANPKPLGANSWWDVRAVELASERTADEAVSRLVLTVELRSYL